MPVPRLLPLCVASFILAACLEQARGPAAPLGPVGEKPVPLPIVGKDSAIVDLEPMATVAYLSSLRLDSSTSGPPHPMEHFGISHGDFELRITHEHPVPGGSPWPCHIAHPDVHNLKPGPGQKLYLLEGICGRTERLDTLALKSVDSHPLYQGYDGGCGVNKPMAGFKECLVVRHGDRYLKVVSGFGIPGGRPQLKLGLMGKRETASLRPSPADAEFIASGTVDTLDFSVGDWFTANDAGAFPAAGGVRSPVTYREALIFISERPAPALSDGVCQGWQRSFQSIMAAPGQELYLAAKPCEAVSGWTPSEWTRSQELRVFTHPRCDMAMDIDKASQCLILKDGPFRLKLAPIEVAVDSFQTVQKLLVESMVPRP